MQDTNQLFLFDDHSQTPLERDELAAGMSALTLNTKHLSQYVPSNPADSLIQQRLPSLAAINTLIDHWAQGESCEWDFCFCTTNVPDNAKESELSVHQLLDSLSLNMVNIKETLKNKGAVCKSPDVIRCI